MEGKVKEVVVFGHGENLTLLWRKITYTFWQVLYNAILAIISHGLCILLIFTPNNKFGLIGSVSQGFRNLTNLQ